MGKLGFGLGVGFHTVAGVALKDGQVGAVSLLPIDVGITYRLDFSDRQFLVPFTGICRSWTFAKQILQKDGQKVAETSVDRFDGVEYTAGIELNLGTFDWYSARTLDRNTGINGTYVLAEYAKVSALSLGQPDLSREEWRLGLRFEF